MDFDSLFTSYYTQYRAESQTPASTDDEYTIAMRFMNDGINRWANYDGVYWKELFDTLPNASDGTKTITSGTSTYTAPTDFKEAGGFIKLRNSSDNNAKSTHPILEAHEAQFRNDNSNFVYFTGSPKAGYTLNFNNTPDSSSSGDVIDYVYYKKPAELSTGTSEADMAIPQFLVYHALAIRFKASRNWSAYQISKRDAEDTLKTMQLDNNSGTWANPWKVADNSGSDWGR